MTDREPPSQPENDPGATADARADDWSSSGKRPPGAPSKIGPYSIRRAIASGGMGTIYQGMQENPRRPVATRDQYEALRFRPEEALWADAGLPFRVQFFHLGSYYQAAVRIFEVNMRSSTIAKITG